ncbi:MAG: VTT domain-containing protein [Alphaproteobacteria bacterium]|nr:VTT domain-containing protein [Alphaproteobacteria bacterium]
MTTPLLQPGRNCSDMAVATHASLLIDCANYYQALHEGISKARHSVFVLGWDIDSRIELVRGKEEARAPTSFFGLIQHVARRRPELRIYLNRWDYSIYMAAEKEALSALKWKLRSPSNVHFCLDGTVPLGACHHQKIVVIDDEIAFCGGMDVARGRWDRREHLPRNRHRVDPPATYQLTNEWKFGPYHDIQMLVAGPAAQCLAELARKRWEQAVGEQAVPLRPLESGALPCTWPETAHVGFRDMVTGIALTCPQKYGDTPIRHAERLYLDLITSAQRFIYLENQYLTQPRIAAALHARLKENPHLRVLMVSSCRPEGIMERKAMWHGRARFMEIAARDNVTDRIVLAYPVSRVQEKEKPVRIHSKIMIVDDRYLRVGSTNLNNRSMSVDTECDLLLEAQNAAQRREIAAARNDLIREHTGREKDDIEALVRSGADATIFMQEIPHSRQHLRAADDSRYRHEFLGALAMRLADPCKAYLPYGWMHPLDWLKRHFSPRWLLIIAFVAALALAWQATPISEYASPEKLSSFFDRTRGSSWGWLAAMLLYALGCTVLIPRVFMNAAVIMVFPPMQAFMIAMGGSCLSCATGFWLGQLLGMKTLSSLVGRHSETIRHYTHQGGIMGITLLRLLPVAPYMIVNLALGMANVSFVVFMTGSFLALLPGTISVMFLGHSLLSLWQDPDPKNALMAGLGVLLWAGLVWGTHVFSRRWQQHTRPAQA